MINLQKISAKSAFFIFLSTLSLGVVTLLSPSKAFATDAPYGSEGSFELVINKEVRINHVGDFVDKLIGLVGGEVLEFRVEVTNTGTITLENISVRDYLPSELELIGFSTSWVIDTLQPGEQRVFYIRAKVKDNIAGINEQVCIVNVAEANGVSDDATFCVTGPVVSTVPVVSKVLSATTILPASGPIGDNTMFFGILGLGLGTLIRKITK